MCIGKHNHLSIVKFLHSNLFDRRVPDTLYMCKSLKTRCLSDGTCVKRKKRI